MNKLRFVCQEDQQLQNIHILYSYPTVQYSMYCIMYYIELYNEHCLVQYECHLEGIACMFVLLLCRRCIEYLHFAMQVHSKIQQSSCKYSQVLYRYVERFLAQFLQSCNNGGNYPQFESSNEHRILQKQARNGGKFKMMKRGNFGIKFPLQITLSIWLSQIWNRCSKLLNNKPKNQKVKRRL